MFHCYKWKTCSGTITHASAHTHGWWPLTHGRFTNHVVEVNSCYLWRTRTWTEKNDCGDVGIWRQYSEAVITHINEWAYQHVLEKSLHRTELNEFYITNSNVYNQNLMCSPCSNGGNDTKCSSMWARCDWRETRCGRGLGNVLRAGVSKDFLAFYLNPQRGPRA